ncbi:MAG: carbamoyltransferase HypF [Chloroflexi bacterium]|nr:carbamoyltransferase HypF [Chloroflexota bacterium]MBP7044471.1 carbamoyltransferase HypF [Chloroflexota bacterium]
MTRQHGKRIHINGIVQGVGFRPFVFGLADRYELAGWVRNTSAGVDIEVDGAPDALAHFVAALTAEAPPLAQIDDLTAVDVPANGFVGFKIVASTAVPHAFQPISPDVCVCDDCLRELFDPADRRSLYPFINCTNCGPRFTIIKDIPYDRPLTTMAPFAMCPDCRREYENPLDRRFHAQPVACPACGPQVWLERGVGSAEWGVAEDSALPTPYSPLEMAQRLLAEGKILAIKGLGGFHLACDALNETAVSTLRARKLRRDKPFALMMPDLETVEQYCYVNESERSLLLSRERPIVLLRRRPDSPIARACAPGQEHLGVMLPYTPLHYLLFHHSALRTPHSKILVMTSGNLSEEPIAYRNDEARERLAALADAFLMHNRDIHVRCDDSVMRIVDWRLAINEEIANRQSTIVNRQLPIRRSRGYAPFPVKLPWTVPPILAAGAELKNTFCLTNGRYAFLSHHIGDLENYETLQSFEQGVAHFETLFRVQPEIIAYDKHPNYLATRYALERAAREGLTAVPVQHHHAHIAACLAENGHPGDRPVIGVSFDGTGYGDDGAIWGGEFFIADYAGYERPYHLVYTPLPGGDLAVREPWRLALAWLRHVNAEWGVGSAEFDSALPTPHSALQIVWQQMEKGINAPPTSSMGRLFDAVAALMGVRQTVNYEAQAAIELEALADPAETGVYPFALVAAQSVVDPGPMVTAVLDDLRRKTPIPTMAARFHNGVAQMTLDVCRDLRTRYNLSEVALSGGVWQNVTLLTRTVPRLQADGFTVYLHSKVPPNDGGLALGQTAVAAFSYRG